MNNNNQNNQMQNMGDTNMEDQMLEDGMIGAIKIKDGLFIGDELAAKDLEFIVTNKVTHVINTAGKQIANLWENIGIAYLTLFWEESDTQELFDPKNETVNEIFDFVKEAHEQGESVLVHSVRGQSRACCVLAAFFMMKYQWTLYKTLEFLNSRRPDLEIRASFFHQLTQLEQKYQKLGIGAKYATWDENNVNDSEDLILRNTFVNAKSAPFADYLMNIQKPLRGSPNKKKKTKIVWTDEKNKKLTQILHPKAQNAYSLASKQNKQQQHKKVVKSIVKGSKNQFSAKTGLKVDQNALNNNKINTSHNQQQYLEQNLIQNQIGFATPGNVNSKQQQQHQQGQYHHHATSSKKNINHQQNQRLNYSQDYDKNPINVNTYNQNNVNNNKQQLQKQSRPNSSHTAAENNNNMNNQNPYNNSRQQNQNQKYNNFQQSQQNQQNYSNQQNQFLQNQKQQNNGRPSSQGPMGQDNNINGPSKINNINGQIIHLTVNNFMNTNSGNNNMTNSSIQQNSNNQQKSQKNNSTLNNNNNQITGQKSQNPYQQEIQSQNSKILQLQQKQQQQHQQLLQKSQLNNNNNNSQSNQNNSFLQQKNNFLQQPQKTGNNGGNSNNTSLINNNNLNNSTNYTLNQSSIMQQQQQSGNKLPPQSSNQKQQYQNSNQKQQYQNNNQKQQYQNSNSFNNLSNMPNMLQKNNIYHTENSYTKALSNKIQNKQSNNKMSGNSYDQFQLKGNNFGFNQLLKTSSLGNNKQNLGNNTKFTALKQYPIKANQDFDNGNNRSQSKDRPGSAQVPDINNQYNNNKNQEKRPASGGSMRHFSPGQKPGSKSKSINSKHQPYPTQIGGSKNIKSGLRYPSPQISGNTGANGNYLSKYKWK